MHPASFSGCQAFEPVTDAVVWDKSARRKVSLKVRRFAGFTRQHFESTVYYVTGPIWLAASKGPLRLTDHFISRRFRDWYGMT